MDFIRPVVIEKLEDRAQQSETGPRTLASYRAVGSVADTLYQSRRIIPAAVQKDAVEAAKASKRQITMFIGHPHDVEMPDWLTIIGDLKQTAAVVDEFHYDTKTKETILDKIRILDTPQGELALRLFVRVS